MSRFDRRNRRRRRAAALVAVAFALAAPAGEVEVRTVPSVETGDVDAPLGAPAQAASSPAGVVPVCFGPLPAPAAGPCWIPLEAVRRAPGFLPLTGVRYTDSWQEWLALAVSQVPFSVAVGGGGSSPLGMVEENGFTEPWWADPVLLAALGVLWLTLLPIAILLLVRLRVGSLPRLADLRHAAQLRGSLDDLDRRLGAWLADQGERLEEGDLSDPVAKLDLLLCRVGNLADDLSAMVGRAAPLPHLHSQLRGMLAKAQRGTGSPTVPALIEEVRRLGALRQAIESGRSEEPGDGTRDADASGDDDVVGLLARARHASALLQAGGAGLPGLPAAALALLPPSEGSSPPESGLCREDLEVCAERLGDLVRLTGCAPGAAPAQQAETVLTALRSREREVTTLRSKLAAEEKRARTAQSRLERIATHLSDTRDTDLVAAVERVAAQPREVRQRLEPWSDRPSAVDKASDVARRLEALVGRHLPAESVATGLWHRGLEESLARGREAVEASRQLAGTAGRFLALDPSAGLHRPDALEELLRREASRPHRLLRLRLVAELEDASALEAPQGDDRLHEALRLVTILPGVRRLLARLHEWRDEESLWKAGLEPAFGNGWLHDLLRARAVLEAYYPVGEEARRFRAVRSLAEAVEDALLELGRPVSPVRLLAPPAASWQTVAKRSALAALPEVRRQVWKVRPEGSSSLVVDVERFAVRGAPALDQCRVVLFNLAEWHPSREVLA